VVYSLFSYHQKNLGDPGSSRGMLERIRVGLTICTRDMFVLTYLMFVLTLLY
jgi:hypothetical protein